MNKKFIKIITLLLVFSFILTGCASKDQPKATDPETDQVNEELVLTTEELSEYDGKDGNPAYIAIDGVIYDVTDATPWADGMHNSFTAGNDLTEEIKTISPHGISKLKEVPIVGKLQD